jgi:hypothetical protein
MPDGSRKVRPSGSSGRRRSGTVGRRHRCAGEGKSYTQAVDPTAGQFPDYPQRTQIRSAKLSNYMDETPQALEKKA